MSTSSASAVATVDAPPSRVFPRLLEHDPVWFYPRWLLLPGVVEVQEQSGRWETPGRTRRLVLSDGGTVVETIREVGAPAVFVYELSDFTGFFGLLVAAGRSEWRLTARDAGTAIHWTYAFTARRGRGALVRAIVRRAWGPYMRRVLPSIAAWTGGDSQTIPTR